MRKYGKKLLSLALVLVMVLAMLPGTAFAAGTWSEWSTTPVYKSDTRQVETRQVKISDAHTEYRYGRYLNAAHNKVCWCATYQESLNGPGSTLDYSAWSATRYSPNSGKSWTCGYCKGKHIGVNYTDSKGRPRWLEYTLPGYSGNFFWEESRNVEAQYETQYRYRDIEPEPKDALTVSFDANGGSVRAVSLYLMMGQPYGSLPEPSRDNYRFDGWYTAASGGTLITSDTTVDQTGNQTLYAHWTEKLAETYTVTFNAAGGSVYPISKTVTEKEPYGDLPTPTRNNYTFDGWYTSASGGSRVTASTTVTQTRNHTLYAHWTSTVNPYNLGEETYSFANYKDSDSPGHCFGMSITSSGYYNHLLDIGQIGGNADTPLNSFSKTKTVMEPICYYQGIQDQAREGATVAGGSYYLHRRYDIASDWRAVVNYVKDHQYDGTGLLQIGYRRDNVGGHAINFLRYENVNGQDRIYAYDNNAPTQETYFYQDSSGRVYQTPQVTFKDRYAGPIDCIALRDCRRYFKLAEDFDVTHAIYTLKDSVVVEGYTYSCMESAFNEDGEEYVVYSIPAEVDRVTISPLKDNAAFFYMDTEYEFGKVSDETLGELELASMNEGIVDKNASFKTYEKEPAAPSSFTDVPAAAWYHDAVYWAVDRGIASGTSSTTFAPDRTCTETEILTFLWRAAGKPASTAKLPFTPKSTWAADALRWAYETGMISASFDENASCTRASAAKFIWQAAGSPATAVANSFTDVPAGAGYAKAVAWAVSKGITNGTSAATFSPDKTCTRAEIVTLLNRAYR